MARNTTLPPTPPQRSSNRAGQTRAHPRHDRVDVFGASRGPYCASVLQCRSGVFWSARQWWCQYNSNIDGCSLSICNRSHSGNYAVAFRRGGVEGRSASADRFPRLALPAVRRIIVPWSGVWGNLVYPHLRPREGRVRLPFPASGQRVCRRAASLRISSSISRSTGARSSVKGA